MIGTAQKYLVLCYHARMMHRARCEQRGQVVPLFALLLVVLIPVIGLTLNVGMLTSEQGYTQRGTDAVALAAAMIITEGQSETNATATGEEVATANDLNLNTLQIEYLDSNGNQTDTASDVAYVQVSDQEQKTALLGGFLGVGWDTVTTKSRAAVGSANPVCGICILSAGAADALSVSGNSSITVDAGAIRVDSNAATALYASGGATISDTQGIELTGNYSSSSNATISPPPATGVSPIRNPLAGIPAPAISGPTYTASGPSSGQTTMQPGIYAGAYSTTQSLSMAPGTYVFENGFSVGGSAALTGNGVTLYFTCSGYSQTDTQPCNSGSAMSSLTINGTGYYSLTAPSSGNYQGIVLMQDPGNTAPMELKGTSGGSVNGTIYAPSSAITITGTSTDATSYDSIIVANTLSVSGNGSVSLDATPQSNAPATYDGGLPYLV